MATTYTIQMGGMNVGLKSPADSTASAIRPQLGLDFPFSRTVIIEPNKVGSGTGSGTGTGGETSVVF